MIVSVPADRGGWICAYVAKEVFPVFSPIYENVSCKCSERLASAVGSDIRRTLRTFHSLSSPIDPGIYPTDVRSPSQSTLIPDLGISHFRRYMSDSTEIDEVELGSRVSRLLPSIVYPVSWAYTMILWEIDLTHLMRGIRSSNLFINHLLRPRVFANDTCSVV